MHNRRTILLLVAAVAVPVAAQTALADNQSEVKLKLKGNPKLVCAAELCTEPGPGNAVTAVYNGQTADLNKACLNVRFAWKDLLAGGDELSFRLSDDLPVVGFENPGLLPQLERTLCLTDEYHPEYVALFEDGAQEFDIFVAEGSVRLVKRLTTVTVYS